MSCMFNSLQWWSFDYWKVYLWMKQKRSSKLWSTKLGWCIVSWISSGSNLLFRNVTFHRAYCYEQVTRTSLQNQTSSREKKAGKSGESWFLVSDFAIAVLINKLYVARGSHGECCFDREQTPHYLDIFWDIMYTSIDQIGNINIHPGRYITYFL